jgi:OOP family OmpA-OmpF porin
MKTIQAAICALLITLSGTAMASDSWYLGATVGHYILDTHAVTQGDVEGSQVGIQFGRYITDNLALDISYAEGVGHDDLRVASMAGILWFGAASDSWRPYGLLAANAYDWKTGNNLSVGHKSSYGRVAVGLGVGTMVNQNYQFRADVRGMFESDEEIGVQLSLNRVFGKKAAPVPVVITPDPVVVEPPKVRTIIIRLDVKFEFNKDVVLAVYGEELETIASAMRAHDDIDLVLQGHTDSTGSDSYNLGLSERRAKAVKAKLSADHDIASERISAQGYGETRPMDSNGTREGRQRNRRVVGEMTYSEVFLD